MTDLDAQITTAESKLAALRSELEVLQGQVTVEEERVSLLRRLLELDSPSTAVQNGPPPTGGSLAQRRESHAVTPRDTVSLEDAVVLILSERSDAVHIGAIHAELLKRGVRIPGKGVDANIIARIIKEPRIEREAGRRGYYRLVQT